MHRLALRRFSSGASGARPAHEVVKEHLRRNAPVPLIQHFRSTWPDVLQHGSSAPELDAALQIPPRTVPDDKLRFQMRTSFNHGTDIFYPHMKIHPADFKVSLLVSSNPLLDHVHALLQVSIDDLGLQQRELEVFREMVGRRVNPGRRELKLVCEQFPNRVENKRYVIYLLEKLLAEAKRLTAEESKYTGAEEESP